MPNHMPNHNRQAISKLTKFKNTHNEPALYSKSFTHHFSQLTERQIEQGLTSHQTHYQLIILKWK